MSDYHRISEGILGEETVEKTNTELFLSLVGQYFPEAIKDGEVDFTALKEEMGEFPQVSSEHYEFTWAGKQAAKKEAQADLYGKTLKYKPKDSVNTETTENIYIEGNNLSALKLLRRNYHGKIKVIYIDPPYNTGNDFVYCDDFTLSEEELAKVSGNIVDGIRYQKNPKDTSSYHTRWLNELYPRLKIARELLSDDGVIFISIDDNEQSNLKKIADEIFGESHFIATFPWRKRTAKSDVPFGVSQDYEWILAYAKSGKFIARVQGKERKYFETPDFPNRPWRIHDLTKQTTASERPNSFFTMVNPKTGDEYPANPNRTWAITEETFKHYYSVDRIVFPGDYDFLSISKPALRYWKEDDMSKAGDMFGMIAVSTKLPDNVGMSLDGTKEITDLFSAKIFSFPKTVELLKYLIDISTKGCKDAIIMDFFSGSSTTAHSVMKLNAEDNGNRKYIMVQLPEVCEEKSEAYKAGYDNICELGKERIRRAAKKIHEDNPDAQFDDGFKVFEVSDTNIKWNTIDDNEVLTLADMDSSISDKDRIDFNKGYTDIDVVYEVMLRQFDIPLSTPIEKLSTVSDRTYIFADAVVVCLEPEIDEQLIERLAAIEPTPAKFVLRDSAFNDDIELKDISFRRLSALIANHQTEEERKSKYNNYTVEFI